MNGIRYYFENNLFQFNKYLIDTYFLGGKNLDLKVLL